MAPEHRDGCLRQSEAASLRFRHYFGNRRPVRICVTVRSIVLPDILFAAEGPYGDGTGEGCLPPGHRIVKNDAHDVGGVFIAVHEHYGPLSIWTVHRVRRD